MDMGAKIKHLREMQQMTLEEVGNKVGVGKSTVRKWENGMIANMRRDKIAKLAAALNCSPAYLMGWSENEIETVAADHAESMEDLASLDAIAEADERAANIDMWNKEFGDVVFTEEEMKQLIDYAMFLISKRKE